jgi:hypothetical protein
MRWIPVVLVIAACDRAPTQPLGALRGKEVSLSWSPVLNEPGKMDVYVGLNYQLDECVTVDATATLDGKRLEVFERGGSGEDQHGGTFCARPGWSGIMPAGGDPASTITIQIEDKTAAITYELTNPLAERTLRASTGGSISIYPGPCSDSPGLTGELVLPPSQEVTLSWSPATDTVTGAVLVGRSAAFDSVFYLYNAHLTVANSTIRFVAPTNAAQAARAVIDGGYVVATRRCEGADACSAGNQYCGEFIVRQP